MKQGIASVISNAEVLPGTHLLWLEAPEISSVARPGQFIMVRCGNSYDPLLRRPVSIHRVAGEEQIALLFNVVGQGTEWLSRCQKGDRLDLLGPLGKGFSTKDTGDLLLVAGGIGIAPLVFLAEKAVREGCSVALLMGAKTGSSLYPGSLLPSKIDVFNVTEDGSEGRRGMVTAFMDDYVSRADQVCACGPVAMYQSIAEKANLKGKSVQISLEMRMGCGVGACYSCTVKTRQGLKQVCQDGPVFELGDIFW